MTGSGALRGDFWEKKEAFAFCNLKEMQSVLQILGMQGDGVGKNHSISCWDCRSCSLQSPFWSPNSKWKWM